MNISTAKSLGVAFSATSEEVIVRDKNELSQENILSNEKADNNKKTIAFSIDNELISLDVSQSTLTKLQDNFGDDSFYQHDNGVTRLNAEAEAFVAGWYKDIAFNRGFKDADSDKDGKLTKNEYLQTKNDFDTFTVAEENSSIKNTNWILAGIESNYQKIDLDIPNELLMEKITSIADELDRTIRVDQNFDGQLELKEFLIDKYKTEDESSAVKQFDNELLITRNTDYIQIDGNLSLDKLKKAISKTFTSLVELLPDKKNIDDEESLEQKAMAKLIASSGNVNLLSAQEKEAISNEISSIKKYFEQDLKKINLLDISV